MDNSNYERLKLAGLLLFSLAILISTTVKFIVFFQDGTRDYKPRLVLTIVALSFDIILTIGFSICVMVICLSIRKLRDLLRSEKLAGGVGMNWGAAYMHLAVVLTFYLTQLIYDVINYVTGWLTVKNETQSTQNLSTAFTTGWLIKIIGMSIASCILIWMFWRYTLVQQMIAQVDAQTDNKSEAKNGQIKQKSTQSVMTDDLR